MVRDFPCAAFIVVSQPRRILNGFLAVEMYLVV
jgi:hypothetical protein